MRTPLLRDDIEYVVHCDDRGTIIGPLSKVHAHMPNVRQALTHYSTWGMVWHPLCQQYGIQLKRVKAHETYVQPRWDIGVAGHNCYVEAEGGYAPLSFAETLVKEADEEIGLTVSMCDTRESFVERAAHPLGTIGYIFDRFHYHTESHNEWIGVGLIITVQEDLTFRDGEVLDFAWYTPEDLRTFFAEGEYYGALPIAFERAEAFRLQYLAR